MTRVSARTWKAKLKLITETLILSIAFFETIFLKYLVEIGLCGLNVN